MKTLAGPFLALVWRTPALRRGVVTCVALALVASAAEIAVALSLVPILSSLGVDAGSDLSSFVGRIPPAAWLVLFVVAAGLRSVANWQSSVQSERNTQALVVSLQTRLYRALAAAHWDAVRRLAPPTITSALQTQTYDAGYGFGNLVQVVAAVLLVFGYMVSAIAVFPLMLPVLLLILVLMWWLNVQRSGRVLAHSEDYHEAQTELHQLYEDWVAISHISSLGIDAAKLSDRFETGAEEAAAHAVGFSHSAAATHISYEAALVIAILIGVPIAWWLETPPALLAFSLVLIVRVLPRAGNIQVGYQGIVNAIAPVQAIERLATELELNVLSQPARDESLSWQRLELNNIGVEDTQRESSRRWILRGVNLELKHGEWLGFTGPTGAGKTTLAEVMLMLVRADTGEIRIDDQVVDKALASEWRNLAAGRERYARIAAAAAMEARDPFLDKRVVDYCTRLPGRVLMKNGWYKWILRDIMNHRLPEDVRWLRGKPHLGSVFNAAVAREALNRAELHITTLQDDLSGYLDPHALFRSWEKFRDGDDAERIHSAYILSVWLRENANRPVVPDRRFG